jgi:hypothetical protein
MMPITRILEVNSRLNNILLYVRCTAEQEVAFMAALTSSAVFNRNQMTFDNIIINDGAGFDNVHRNRFVAPADGFYWFHMSVGIPAKKKCNVTMITGSDTLSVIRSVGLDELIVTSRTGFMSLRKSQEVAMVSENALFSDRLMQTSWIGFRLDNIMSPFVALFIGSNGASLEGRNLYGIQSLVFNSVFIDTHNAWNVTNSVYKIPVTGFYFVSLQLDSINSCELYIELSAYGLYRFTHNSYVIAQNGLGTRTFSKSLLIFFQVGDIIGLRFGVNKPCGSLYINETIQATLSLFLYQPIAGSRIAWLHLLRILMILH